MQRTTFTAAATAALLAVPTVALAHPAFNPGHVPAGQEQALTLVVPHGCDPEGGMPEEGSASPTTEVAVRVPEGVTTVDPAEKEGWVLTLDESGEGVSSFTWAADTGATTDVIEFAVELTVAGDASGALYFPVFQGCEEGSIRWVGTPDDEAEFPATVLTVGEASTADPAPADHGSTSDEQTAGESTSGEASPTADEPGPDDTDQTEVAPTAADADTEPWILGAVIVALLAGAGILVARRST